MCPMCVTTAMIAAASTASGAGVISVLAMKMRGWRGKESPRQRSSSEKSTRHDDRAAR